MLVVGGTLPIIFKVGSKATCDLSQIGHAPISVHFLPGVTKNSELYRSISLGLSSLLMILERTKHKVMKKPLYLFLTILLLSPVLSFAQQTAPANFKIAKKDTTKQSLIPEYRIGCSFYKAGQSLPDYFNTSLNRGLKINYLNGIDLDIFSHLNKNNQRALYCFMGTGFYVNDVYGMWYKTISIPVDFGLTYCINGIYGFYLETGVRNFFGPQSPQMADVIPLEWGGGAEAIISLNTNWKHRLELIFGYKKVVGENMLELRFIRW